MGANRVIKLTGRGELQLFDGTNTKKTSLRSAASLAADRSWVLPSADGTANQALTTDGAGNLGWGFNSSTTLNLAYTGGNVITVTGSPVEIDKTTGGELLKLYAATSGVPYLSVVANAREARFGADAAGSGFVGTQSAHSFEIRTGGTARWTVDSSGNLSGTGTFASGAAAIKGSLKVKGPYPFYDVTHADWGAVGDDSTDDSAAIQAVIAAAVAAGGGTIFFPQKIFKITNGLTIPITARNITLLGYGAKLHYTKTTLYSLTIGDLSTTNDRAEHIAVCGLRFGGLGKTDASSQGGIAIYASLDVVLRDVEVTEFPGIGIIGLKSAASGSAYWNQVALDHVKIRYTGRETLQVGYTGAACDDLTVLGCLFNNGGKKIAASALTDGGVFVRVSSLSWNWGEVSYMANDDGINGYLNGLVIRRATGTVNGIHFEGNGNDQVGSADAFFDTDAEGLVFIGSDHSCDNASSAEVGIKVRSPDVTIIGPKHNTNNATHRFTYLVDAQGAVNTVVLNPTKIVGGADPATDWVLWNKDATPYDALIGAIRGELYCGRFKPQNGRQLQTSDFALSSGFGATATVSLVTGNDQRFTFRVNASAVGLGASPTITLTFKGGTWTQTPFAFVQRTGGNQGTIINTWTVSATQVIITFVGTPVAGEVYDFTVLVIG